MPNGKYNIKGDALVQGINIIVRVDLNDENGSDPQEIGFIETYDISQNIQTQKAEVIGEFLAVAIDATGVAVIVSLTGFIPSKNLIEGGIDTVRGGGKVMLKAFNPDTSKLVDTKVITKIPYLDLWDEKHQSIIGSVSWLTPSSYKDTGQGKGYTKSNVTMEGIVYDNGPDYESAI